jgi:hypothetical protein
MKGRLNGFPFILHSFFPLYTAGGAGV